MGVFHRNTSGKLNRQQSLAQKPKLEKADKMNKGDVENSVLTAVSELQPFEQAAGPQRKQSYLLANSHNLTDIFGTKITNSDISNPTRARNERPLDTIRAFEYAITGDIAYRDQLELHRLGWGFHDDFLYQNLLRAPSTMGMNPNASRPTYNFNSGLGQLTYSAPKPTSVPKKKKRGLFGRKK